MDVVAEESSMRVFAVSRQPAFIRRLSGSRSSRELRTDGESKNRDVEVASQFFPDRFDPQNSIAQNAERPRCRVGRYRNCLKHPFSTNGQRRESGVERQDVDAQLGDSWCGMAVARAEILRHRWTSPPSSNGSLVNLLLAQRKPFQSAANLQICRTLC
jgi:hypothetical protein